VLKELAVERFQFNCPHCEASWTADYDVQHVADGHGHVVEYYALNGLPAASPFAVACRSCGAQMRARLVARRDIPLAPTPGPDAGTPLTAQRQADRQAAPLLQAESGPAAEKSTPPT
jgi:hypothetical protein